MGFAPKSQGQSDASSFSVFPQKPYPTDQFILPVHFPISLAGNYGECRPNHFHSGLDIRTQQTENKPVHAIDDGFVSRVHISSTGFGNALYVSHPGGYTSLYAHLNSFEDRIQKVVEMLQYGHEKWDIDLYLPYWMLIVAQDEQIALSGNTGSSIAPHLHLEIRDNETGNTLNPWLFGFKIPDHSAPKILSLGIYNLDDKVLFYDQDPKYMSINSSSDSYRLSETIEVASDKVGFSVESIDYMDDHFGKMGTYETQMYLDGKLYFAWQVDDINYDDTRYLHAFSDYLAFTRKRKWYEYIFRLPGNHLDIYHDPAKKDGIVNLIDGKVHQIELRLFDVLGNKSTLSFAVKKSGLNTQDINCTHIRKPNVNQLFRADGASIEFDANAFYTTLCANIIKQNASTYIIGNAKYPVHNYYRMIFNNIYGDTESDNIIVEQIMEGDTAVKAMPAYLDGAKIICEGFRDFGQYRLALDHTAPIMQTSLHEGSLLHEGAIVNIYAKDGSTELSEFRVTANGHWLCFKRKKHNYSYKIDRNCPKGDVELIIKATDASKNVTTKKLKIKVQ